MLNDTIVLPVDKLNDGTPTDKTFTRSSEFQNRSVYSGPLHSAVEKDTLSFYRSYEKRNGNFLGVFKASVKLSQDMNVPGYDNTTTINAPSIIEVNFSIPVGVTAAQMLEQRQAIIALLDNDTVMTELLVRQII